jgi:betaine-homocysteine S-methyltransferase
VGSELCIRDRSIVLKVPASKYRENMENHFMYGKNKRIPKHMMDYGDKA